MRHVLLLGLGLLCLALRPAPAQGAAEARGREVVRLLDATRMAKAEAMLAKVPDGDDWKPLATAMLEFHHGDYAAAEAALPAPGSREEQEIAWLRPRILAAKQATAGFQERKEQNFLYRYPAGPESILVDYAIDALEGQRAAMARVLGVAPERPVVIEFFAALDGFVAASGLPAEWVETTNTVAICKWDRMLVLSPMHMRRGYPWKDTIAHEYVHLVVSRASGNQAPVWFQEGSAKVMESWWRKGPRPGALDLDPYSESMLARAKKDKSLIKFESMHPSMAALPSSDAAGLAFAEVATAVDFILGEIGEPGYRRIVEQTALHGDVMRAVDEVMGLHGGGFEKRWLRWLEAQPHVLRNNVASLAQSLEAGAGAQVDDEGTELDPVLLAHRAMQDFTRLGDLLRNRGHLEAALVEYGKASDAESFHSPALANKQARTLQALGQADFARDLLQESVALYPEYTPTVTLLAELAFQSGDAQEAEARAWQSIGLNPFDPSPHAVLALVYAESERPVEAAREKNVIEVLSNRGW
jgi:tetratricopeptide (TPR) repeat protein